MQLHVQNACEILLSLEMRQTQVHGIRIMYVHAGKCFSAAKLSALCASYAGETMQVDAFTPAH